MFKTKGQAFLGLLVGIGALAFGIYSWFDTEAFFKNAKQTTATVSSVTTEYEKDGDEKNRIYYDYTVDGKEYSEYETKTGITSIKQGEKFTIYYNPSDPSDARFEKKATMLPWICMGLGVVVLIMALMSLFKKPKS